MMSECFVRGDFFIIWVRRHYKEAQKMRGYDTKKTCRCGARYNGSDHCPKCGNEQYEYSQEELKEKKEEDEVVSR